MFVSWDMIPQMINTDKHISACVDATCTWCLRVSLCVFSELLSICILCILSKLS